jgi:hypothetical protein
VVRNTVTLGVISRSASPLTGLQPFFWIEFVEPPICNSKYVGKFCITAGVIDRQPFTIGSWTTSHYECVEPHYFDAALARSPSLYTGAVKSKIRQFYKKKIVFFWWKAGVCFIELFCNFSLMSINLLS